QQGVTPRPLPPSPALPTPSVPTPVTVSPVPAPAAYAGHRPVPRPVRQPAPDRPRQRYHSRNGARAPSVLTPAS
ncbi:MAG: hypothetical protein EON55_26470, partial [Alphaproteobacteria bacterium]